LAAAALLLLVGRWGEPRLSGLAPILAGILLRLWALGHLEKDLRLTTSGPYRYVRNPLYLANLLLASGAGVMVAGWWLAALLVVLMAAAFHRTALSEEKALAKQFGEQYLRYCRATPRWLPKLARIPGSPGKRFSWRLALDNDWHHAFLPLVAWLILVDLMDDVVNPWLFQGASLASGPRRMWEDLLSLLPRGRF
jgi:hypothetical protein